MRRALARNGDPAGAGISWGVVAEVGSECTAWFLYELVKVPVGEVADVIGKNDETRLHTAFSKVTDEYWNTLADLREAAIDRLVCEGVEIDQLTLWYDAYNRNEPCGVAVTGLGAPCKVFSIRVTWPGGRRGWYGQGWLDDKEPCTKGVTSYGASVTISCRSEVGGVGGKQTPRVSVPAL